MSGKEKIYFMKSWVESFLIALSMYSTIPVKCLDWNKNNLRHAMIFFPLIGLICGFGIGFIWYIFKILQASHFLFAVFALLITVIITGGIHLDGFCDTADALFSRRSQEEKLKILKDAHCGAFAVVSIILIILLQVADFSEIFLKFDINFLGIITGGYMLSRCLSAISVMTFPCAKTSSLAKTFSEYAGSGSKKILIAEFILIGFILIYFYHKLAMLLISSAILVFIYYYQMQKKQFGGMTGDLAGFFLVLCETVWLSEIALLGGILT